MEHTAQRERERSLSGGISMEHVDMWTMITVDDCVNRTSPTTEFLCPLDANVVDLELLALKVWDEQLRSVVYDVRKDPRLSPLNHEHMTMFPAGDLRWIKMELPSCVLQTSVLKVLLLLSTGKFINQLQIVDKIYVEGVSKVTVVASTGPLQPSSINSIEYAIDIANCQLHDVMANNGSLLGDCFIFCDGALTMHCRVEYHLTD